MKLLLTGATGFVGQKLVPHLLETTDTTLHLTVRSLSDQVFDERVILTRISDISPHTVWHEALVDCQVVIHAAARVHIMEEQAKDPLSVFREVNVGGTLNLARQAAEAGVRRFIYLSSIKVNGEYSLPDKPFSPEDLARPTQAYSISKYEAEQGLMDLAEKSQMEVVIIRPPLVYGPGVKGNFLSMLQLLQKGTPLPLGGLKKNKRSFVSIDNLVTLIKTCVTHPSAANQIFLVSDNEDLSTTILLRKLRQLFENQAPLLPVPSWLLNAGAILLGKKSEIMRLSGSLQVDISKSCKLLNWQPSVSVDEALYKTVKDYIDTFNFKSLRKSVL